MSHLLKFRFSNFSLIVGLVLIFGGWLWAYFALHETNLPVIVHFSNVSGINQVGYFWDLSKVAIFGGVVIVLNFLISRELDKRDRFFGKLTSAATFLVGILIFIYFAAIISVN